MRSKLSPSNNVPITDKYKRGCYMNKSIFDIGVSIGKFGVENSNLSRDDKELAKSRIDLLGEIFKLAQPQPVNPSTVYGLGLTTIQRIKIAAAQCSVERVVLFPMFYANGRYEILIRVYGSDADAIFNSFNVYQLGNITESDKIELDRLEKENGVIIYEKE